MGVVYKQEIVHKNPDSPTLKLSASVGADSFFYAIEDEQTGLIDIQAYHTEKEVLLYKDSLDFIGDVMGQNPILFDPFKTIYLGISNIPYRLVTNAQIKASGIHQLLSEVTLVAAEDDLHSQSLDALEIVCIFALPRSLKEEIEMYFDSAEFLHTYASMLNYLASEHQWVQYDQAMHLDFCAGHINLSMWQHGQLVDYQQWPAAEAIDIQYHITAAQKKMEWAQTKLLVTGSRIEELMADTVLKNLFDSTTVKLNMDRWPSKVHHLISLYAISKCG